MMLTGRVLVLSAAVLTAAAALSGCQSQDVKSKEASSASSAASTAVTTSAATTATTTSSPVSSAKAAPAGDKVAPADLPAIVSDRTFRGDSEGTAYSEYYAPDGSLRGKSGTGSYTGNWKVAGEQLCFTYMYPDKAENETDCYAVFKNGDVITWVDKDGELVDATFAEGNPDGL